MNEELMLMRSKIMEKQSRIMDKMWGMSRPPSRLERRIFAWRYAWLCRRLSPGKWTRLVLRARWAWKMAQCARIYMRSQRARICLKRTAEPACSLTQWVNGDGHQFWPCMQWMCWTGYRPLEAQARLYEMRKQERDNEYAEMRAA